MVFLKNFFNGTKPDTFRKKTFFTDLSLLYIQLWYHNIMEVSSTTLKSNRHLPKRDHGKFHAFYYKMINSVLIWGSLLEQS